MYALVNEGNIQSLTKELLDYLQVADADFKPDLTAKIAALVQRFAPNKRWHFDSLLQVRCLLANARSCAEGLVLSVSPASHGLQCSQDVCLSRAACMVAAVVVRIRSTALVYVTPSVLEVVGCLKIGVHDVG